MCRGFDPLFSLWQDRARSFWGIFLIHQQQSYLLGYKNYQFLQKSIFLAPNSIFSSIFLGPIFSGQRHTPISFQAEYHPPPPPPECLLLWIIHLSRVWWFILTKAWCACFNEDWMIFWACHLIHNIMPQTQSYGMYFQLLCCITNTREMYELIGGINIDFRPIRVMKHLKIFCLSFWTVSSNQQKRCLVSYHIITIVPAGEPAPLSATIYADILVAMFGSFRFMWDKHLWGELLNFIDQGCTCSRMASMTN